MNQQSYYSQYMMTGEPGASHQQSISRESEKKSKLPWILFIVTVFTTISAGTMQQGLNPFGNFSNWIYGIPFSFTLLLILGVHEGGHYFMCKAHGIPSTVPYFIPMPNLLGTLGAFIKIKGIIPNKRVLLDIGMAGPLAGFVLALPATIIGFILSTPVPIYHPTGFNLGNNLLGIILKWIVFPDLPQGFEIMLHPVGFAGYIGLLVTALNLMPVSQLDGGHIASAVLGKKQWDIAKYFLAILFLLGFFWEGWWIWMFLLVIMGYRHPVFEHDARPLGPVRSKLAWLTLIIFVMTFVPIPFSI